jgi:hypothetical protein
MIFEEDRRGVHCTTVCDLFLLPLEEQVEILGQFMAAVGTQDDLQAGDFFKQPFAMSLSHTAQETEQGFSGLLGSLTYQHSHFVQSFLLCAVTYAAGIEEDDVGRLF